MNAIRIALIAVLALGACEAASPQPPFRATCAPVETQDAVTCEVQNLSSKPRRACVTARVVPTDGLTLHAQRLCTAVLSPQQTATLKPRFQVKSLLEHCVRSSQWSCKVETVESPETMAENQPSSP